jgi:hypothetical protein
VSRQRRVSLCETLDRVLNKGAVIAGDIVISVADVELLYVGLNLVVTSVEAMRACASEGPYAPGRRLLDRSADNRTACAGEPSVQSRRKVP